MVGGNEDSRQLAALFTRLWSDHERLIRASCARWTRNPQDAEEAYSRAAILVFTKYPEHRTSVRNPRGWMLRLVHNVCMDIHRENRRRPSSPIAEVVDILPDDLPGPERVCLDAELRVVLLGLVDRLPDTLRDTLRLHLVDQLPNSRIAEVQGISEANVRKRLQLGREALTDDLRAYARGNRIHYGPLRQTVPRARERALLDALRVEALAHTPARGPGRRQVIQPLCHPPGNATDTAVEALERYIRRHPTGWKKHLELAHLRRERGELGAAATHYRAVLDKRPRHVLAWRALAEITAVRDPRGAAAIYRTALEHCPDSPAIDHYLAGMAHLHEGDPAETVRHLQASLEHCPDATAPRLSLARLHLREGRYAAAEALCNEGEVDVAKAAMAFDAGVRSASPGRALRALRHSRKAAPDDPLLLVRCVDHALCTRGSLQGAPALVERLRSTAPDLHGTRMVLALLDLCEGRRPPALDGMRAWVRRHPGDDLARIALARVRHATGQHVHPRLSLRRAWRTARAYIDGLLGLPDWLCPGPSGRRSARRALSAPTSPLDRAHHLADRGNLQPAVDHVLAWFEAGGRTAEAGTATQGALFVAHGLTELGRPTSAEPWFEQALQRAALLEAEAPVDGHWLAAQALAGLGELSGARDHLRLISDAPVLPIWRRLARHAERRLDRPVWHSAALPAQNSQKDLTSTRTLPSGQYQSGFTRQEQRQG